MRGVDNSNDQSNSINKRSTNNPSTDEGLKNGSLPGSGNEGANANPSLEEKEKEILKLMAGPLPEALSFRNKEYSRQVEAIDVFNLGNLARLLTHASDRQLQSLGHHRSIRFIPAEGAPQSRYRWDVTIEYAKGSIQKEPHEITILNSSVEPIVNGINEGKWTRDDVLFDINLLIRNRSMMNIGWHSFNNEMADISLDALNHLHQTGYLKFQ